MPAGKITRVYSNKAKSSKNVNILQHLKSIERRINIIPYRNNKAPFPARLRRTIMYGDFLTLSSAAGAYTEQVYNMNSIFDPDRTGAGHQPYAHDTYAEMYNKYRVLKFKYLIKGICTSAGGGATTVTIVPNQSSSTLGSASLAIETPQSRNSLTALNTSPLIFKGTIDLARFNGRSKEQYKSDDLFSSQFNTSPSEVMCLHIGTSRPDGVACSAVFTIQLQYDVEMYDPLELAQS